jgi:serine/threonine-protein kinase
MGAINSNLSNTFCQKFGITEIHETFTGGQKHVFVVTRNGEKCVLKVFKNYGKREVRELVIYEEFKNLENIPKIISSESHDGDKIIFESYVEGKNLQDITINYKGNESLVNDFLVNLCSTLKPFWERKPSIVHRDIKPQNIIIKKDNSLVLLDFGIARDLGDDSITGTGQPQPGSWRFSAPEQFSGEKDQITYRTDFFSIGVLGYYLLYGMLPFGNTIEIIETKFNEDDLSCHLDENSELTQFFKAIFKKLPAERPRTPDLLIKLLRE